MSEPIVFISRNRIKEGMAEEFRKHYHASVQPTFDAKPGKLAQLGYENEEGTEIIVVRVFPNADALDQQIQGADERSKKTYEYIEPTAIGIFGTPNPATLEKMKKIVGSGIAVSISPTYSGGFIR
jgi:quinol monooxygenase YgiN